MSTILFDAGLPQRFWAEAWRFAVYMQNRVYSSSVGNTPYFLLQHKKPKVHYFWVFGCEAWVLIPKALRRKSEPRSTKMIFVGYEPGSKAWRFAYLSGNQSRLVISNSVEFCEQAGRSHLHGNPDVLSQQFFGSDGEEEEEEEFVAEDQSPEQQSPPQGESPQQGQLRIHLRGKPTTPPQTTVKSEPKSEPSSPAGPAVRFKRRSRSEGEFLTLKMVLLALVGQRGCQGSR